MPTYEFACSVCGQINEHVCRMDERPDFIQCHCGCGVAHHVLSLSSIKLDKPVWLDDSVRNAIQDESEPPIETRGQLEKACRDKGIVCTG